MNRFVVDASVAVKWLVPEIHADAALRLLEKNNTLAAPDLIFSEIGNVLLKKSRVGEIESDAAVEMLTDFKGLPLQTYKTYESLEYAWTLAESNRLSFYDSLYVALSLKTSFRMVTADKKLYNSLKNATFKKYILWVEDIP